MYCADGMAWLRIDKDTDMNDVEFNKQRERQLHDTCEAILMKHEDDLVEAVAKYPYDELSDIFCWETVGICREPARLKVARTKEEETAAASAAAPATESENVDSGEESGIAGDSAVASADAADTGAAEVAVEL